MQRLTAARIWDGMSSAMLADLARLFFLVAPFTLLPAVAVELFGPPVPATLAAITPSQMVFRLALPSLIGAIGQLAAAGLVLRVDAAPRDALRTAFAMWPAFVVAQLLGSFPVGIAGLLLVLPGVWLFGRLLFVSGALAMAEGGTPFQLLRRNWALTENAGLQIFLFLLLGLLGLLGIEILAEGAGAALQVVAGTIGLGGVGHFLRALVPGIANGLVTIAIAVAGVVAYRQLAD
ncbi:MAG: hypothetical protein WCO11_06335 [Sphingomonadales bacterium]|jgi:hypothetical protein